MIVSNFDLATIESISQVLGDTSEGLTGSKITKFLGECKIVDPCPNSTKWKRLDEALKLAQNSDYCANNVVRFISHVMRPSRHLNNQAWFEDTRYQLNKALLFEGLKITESGQIEKCVKANTITEADARVQSLKQNLVARKVHPDVMYFCKAELVVDNYFHAVFEATKSIAEKIRIKTGLTTD
ncbi:MAG: TIGR02391 family protein, partial [Thiolinea sp.]